MEGSRDCRRVFVSRLAPYTKKKDLMRFFGGDGILSAVVRRKPTGNTAYLTFATEEQAARIVKVSAEKGYILHKKRLRVLIADPWQQIGKTKSAVVAGSMRSLDGSEEKTGSLAGFLPEECIGIIAQYLSFADRASMECVNRRWRRGVLASYRRIRVLTLGDWRWDHPWALENIKPEKMYWLLKRIGPGLRSLVWDEPDAAGLLQPQLISIAAKFCPRLECLNTLAVTLRPGSLRALGEHVNTLKELYLGTVVGPVDLDLGAVFRNNPGLETITCAGTELTGKSLSNLKSSVVHFNVSDCSFLRTEHLARFASDVRGLVSLRVDRCRRVSGGPLLQALVANPSLRETLEVLQLPALGYYAALDPELDEDEGDFEPLPDVQFFALLPQEPIREAPTLLSVCSRLHTLEVPMCSWVDNIFIREMGSNLHQLTHLDVTACTNIVGEEALDPLASVTSLRSLSVSNMHPSVTMGFLPSLINLESLEARENPGISVEDVCGLLNHASNLHHLDLEGCRSIDGTVVTCAYETLRVIDRRVPLQIFLGGTRAEHRRKDKKNYYLNIHYKRLAPQIPF